MDYAAIANMKSQRNMVSISFRPSLCLFIFLSCYFSFLLFNSVAKFSTIVCNAIYKKKLRFCSILGQAELPLTRHNVYAENSSSAVVMYA